MKYPEQFRVAGHPTDDGGAFNITFSGRTFFVIASHGGGWDHISVSLDNRTPSWKEMCYLKNLFFGKDSLVVQYHPPEANYKNYHPYCLHLWRPHDNHIQLPPIEYV